MKTLINKRIKAYTLTEILIVLAIIGILIVLAMPKLLPLITKAKNLEAKLQLQHAQQLEQAFFFEKSKYSADLSEIGYLQEKLTTEAKDGKANYRLTVPSATNNAFMIRATAVVDFDGDGTFNVWEIDQDKNLKEIIPD